jgi:hypothetical protein
MFPGQNCGASDATAPVTITAKDALKLTRQALQSNT